MKRAHTVYDHLGGVGSGQILGREGGREGEEGKGVVRRRERMGGINEGIGVEKCR